LPLINSAQVCPHVSHLPFSSIPFPSSPNWRGVHTLRPVHCNVHYGPTITQPFHRCDTFENRRFERLLKPVKAAIVYLQCIFRDSHCYFSSMPLKSGVYGTPHSKKWGYAYPRTPRKLRLCLFVRHWLSTTVVSAFMAVTLFHWKITAYTVTATFICCVNLAELRFIASTF